MPRVAGAAPHGVGRRGLVFVGAVLVFVALFAPSSPVSLDSPWKVVVGILIIAVHWLVNGRATPDAEWDEAANANYFLGFIMTLLFLVFDLLATDVLVNDDWIQVFVHDLGIGLSFSVVGLTFRQLSVLANGARSEEVVPGSTESWVQAAQVIEQRLKALDGSLDHLQAAVRESTPDELAGMVGKFSNEVSRATENLSGAVGASSKSILDACSEMESAVSRSRTAMTGLLEELRGQVARIKEEISQERGEVIEVLEAAAEESETTRGLMTAWQENIRESRRIVVATTTRIEKSAERGIQALDTATTRFDLLAAGISRRTEALPDPTERIKGLWNAVQDRERALVTQLDQLRDSVTALSTVMVAAVDRLDALDPSASSKKIADAAQESALLLKSGAAQMQRTLADEAAAIDKLLEELYNIIERQIGRIGRA